MRNFFAFSSDGASPNFPPRGPSSNMDRIYPPKPKMQSSPMDRFFRENSLGFLRIPPTKNVPARILVVTRTSQHPGGLDPIQWDHCLPSFKIHPTPRCISSLKHSLSLLPVTTGIFSHGNLCFSDGFFSGENMDQHLGYGICMGCMVAACHRYS